MPLKNRVLPTGEIVSHPSKAGLFMGNRGILHGEDRTLGSSRWKQKNWIICALDFSGRKRELMSKGCYTELFFLDEAVALAAGHRPCAECRRAVFLAYRSAFARVNGAEARAGEIDKALHAVRVDSRRRLQIRLEVNTSEIPDGAMVHFEGEAWLLRNGRLLHYTPDGYDTAMGLAAGTVTVLTPKPSVIALQNGFVPVVHPSADAFSA
ncbi:hypothetical protein FP2506_15354 [Fulvimarina pelagi HTCC2506]|uniref:Uncharacterized protein n=1 Tax=Fulvimarina pelagi HTCC2506 TaxID=314231 RepID=Q0G3K9_9HYPH|nr:hypothetical protein [Fulvimarina pelagi]EAU41822.1 hypothetical protein FP2506_15354 [Fulvimarina pelagi HTCC2506]